MPLRMEDRGLPPLSQSWNQVVIWPTLQASHNKSADSPVDSPANSVLNVKPAKVNISNAGEDPGQRNDDAGTLEGPNLAEGTTSELPANANAEARHHVEHDSSVNMEGSTLHEMSPLMELAIAASNKSEELSPSMEVDTAASNERGEFVVSDVSTPNQPPMLGSLGVSPHTKLHSPVIQEGYILDQRSQSTGSVTPTFNQTTQPTVDRAGSSRRLSPFSGHVQEPSLVSLSEGAPVSLSRSESLPPHIDYPPIPLDRAPTTTPSDVLQSITRIQDEMVDALGWAMRVHMSCEVAARHLCLYGRLPTFEESMSIRSWSAHRLPPALGGQEQSFQSVHAKHLTLLAMIWDSVADRTAVLEKENQDTSQTPKDNDEPVDLNAEKSRKRRRK